MLQRFLGLCCAAAILAAGASTSAYGAYDVWLPYANMSADDLNTGSPMWGGVSNDLFHQLYPTDGGNNSNIVWKDGNVFYNTGTCPPESWYDHADGDKAWQIYLNNAGSNNFSGTSKLRITVYKGTAAATSTSLYNQSCYGETAATLLDTTSNTDKTVWNSAGYFEVDLPAGQSTFINSTGGDGLLNVPNAKNWAGLYVKVSQPDGYEFDASLRGQGDTRYRKLTGWGLASKFSEQFPQFNFGYAGIKPDAYITGTNYIMLPFWREQNLSDPTKMGWGSIIYIINASTSSDTITVQASNFDGTKLNSSSSGQHFITKTLAAGERWAMSPSQLETTGSSFQGRLEIWGTHPVAVALQARFGATGSSITGSYNGTVQSIQTRASGDAWMPFIVNPQ